MGNPHVSGPYHCSEIIWICAGLGLPAVLEFFVGRWRLFTGLTVIVLVIGKPIEHRVERLFNRKSRSQPPDLAHRRAVAAEYPQSRTICVLELIVAAGGLLEARCATPKPFSVAKYGIQKPRLRSAAAGNVTDSHLSENPPDLATLKIIAACSPHLWDSPCSYADCPARRAFGSANRTQSCARTTRHAGQPSRPASHKTPTAKGPDAQLSAPALHLPTPRATG